MKDYEEKVIDIMDGVKDNIRTQLKKAYICGYEQGYEDGKKVSCDRKDNMETEYNCGLNDAWETSRKIAIDEGLPVQEVVQIFGTSSFSRILKENTASEAIAKIKEYEEQQKQDIKEYEEQQKQDIKVGDEVYSEEYDLRFVVTRIMDGRYEGICTDGACYCPLPLDIKKTGRYAYRIIELLRELEEKGRCCK